MILINGEQKKTLDITDRGLHYGDGLFETIEVTHQKPVFLAQHLTRLKAGCQILKIPYPAEKILLDEISEVCQSAEQAIIKIILTRGSGGRGYRQPEAIHTTRIVARYPFPDFPDTYTMKGINVRFCELRLGLNPMLAGLKHNNRLEQVLARAEWNDEFAEGFMLNLNEHVIEGTMSNLFVVKDKMIFTPEINVSGIKGVMRHVIMQIAATGNISVKEMTMNKDFVLAADEIFVTNSVIGIWPVKSLQNSKFSVGRITTRLMASLAEYKQREIAQC